MSTSPPISQKGGEVLAEDANFPGDISGSGDQADRVRVATQHFAHRRAADRGRFGPRHGLPQRIAGSEIAG
jgi:hypothetical protein